MDDDDSHLVRFAADLRRLREKAGAPPYRKLARSAHYSSTTLADAAAGRKLPSLPVTLGYVRACGGDTAEWEQRWHLLSAELAQADELPGTASDAGEDCPYAGLRPFEAGDAGRFFGRERLTEALETRVRGNRFVAVFGASGCGKSSLLRAGLLPRVSGGPAPWTAVVLAPGPHPFEECAARLSALTGTSAVTLHEDLRTGPRALHLTALQLLAGRPPESELLLVIDQFEEIFTLCADAEERAAFIAALLTATRAANSRTRVVLGVRADFYSACSQHPDLASAIQDAQLIVGPMTTDELRRAITQPAVDAESTVEGPLLARVVAEATGQAGILPLVSHAMRETWRRRRGNTLTVSGYEAAGGIAHALANTAETVYAGFSGPQQRLARGIFLRLVSLNEGTEASKRRLARDELDPGAEAVVDALVRARLVTLDTDSVEITHEALLHAWPRLSDWISDDRAGLLVQHRLTDAALAWDREQRDASALYRGSRLAVAQEWAQAHADDGRLSRRAREFLAASTRQQGRGRRRRRAAFAGLCLLTLLAVVAAGTALQQRSTARSERDSAVSGEVQAEADQLRGTDQSLAARLDVAGYRIHPTDLLSTDLLGTQTTPLSTPLTGHSATVYAVAFSARGHLMATAGQDDTVRLWSVAGATPAVPLGHPIHAHSGGVMWLSFSPDGRTLAGAGRDHTVRLWNLRDPKHPVAEPALRGHTGIVFSVSFGPDGRTLASAGDDGTVRLWDLSDPARPGELGEPLRSQRGAIASATFSPDGRVLASAGHDHTIQLWNVTDPAKPARWGPPLRGHTDTVYAVAFSKDSRTMASVGNDFTVRLWNVSDPAGPVPLSTIPDAATNTIYAVAFSPDGKVLATAGADQTVRLWNVTDPTSPLALCPPLTGHTGYVYWLAFSPDGRILASAGAGGAVRLWDLPRTVLPTPSYENTVAFSPDGRLLAAGATDGAIRFWNTADAGRPTSAGAPALGNAKAVNGLAFSPDGRLLASAGRDGTLRLWNVNDPARAHEVSRLVTDPARTAVTTVAFSPNGSLLACAGYDHLVRLWDVTDPAVPHEIGTPLTAHSDTVRALAFSPDGRTLASAGADDTTRLWNVTDPAHPRQWGPPLAAHTGGVGSVAFSPDGRTLATANDDHTVRLWNVSDPRRPAALAAPLTGHTSFVLSVAFSHDGRTLVSSGDDGTIRLWNVTDPTAPKAWGGAVGGHTGPIDQVTLSPDGHTLASAGDDHTVQLQSVESAQAIRRICSVTPGTLTRQAWRQYVSATPYREVCG
ncbi:nSTAND1 domain-containing NTPase [Actinacidiphila acidipaludis]|uniref:Novel STAND NTPase 1 domain-containing protein n=1 Tax=Actinacidiphila acidipaludis TaxID=2873382 RepID=A0ABS7QDF7_9ACTN|nr:hypothetical protein [Streptomyces acidipaludis]MBY8881201.1 hypothetical protein [Streptomyces acidipaludis]